MQVADHIPEDPERVEWDVIVVGTGMGGSTAGFELARLGRRVLFMEKGKFLHDDPKTNVPPSEGYSATDIRLLTGRWPQPIRGRTSFGQVEFFAPMGCGSGGSTAIYGGQLERFTRTDFHPRSSFPDDAEATLPEQWPISYDDFVPLYRRAEALYNVCGTQDPLNPDPDSSLREPPPLSERDQALHDSLVDLGLHPYRSHVGYHQIEGCDECLDLCLRNCKSDAGSKALVPALTTHGASILPECEVEQLIATRSRVSGVRATWKGKEITVSARATLLASGAFMTPVLLQRSRSADWPDGVANRSGLVGRNLMLHASDFLTIDQPEFRSAEGPNKSLVVNDFYFDEGKKLGTFQAVGLPILQPFILAYLRYVEERDPRWWRRVTSGLMPKVAEIAARKFRRATLFSSIVEDLPYVENRVMPDPSAPNGWRFEYTYTRDLHERNRQFRKKIAQILAGRHKVRVVTGGKNNINYGHVCGTCRFGEDPGQSVLDPNNRAHGLDNLYVVDSSFFPSSGGTNPSLTIAANALRVGGIVNEQLG